jgi:hypothetical protein
LLGLGCASDPPVQRLQASSIAYVEPPARMFRQPVETIKVEEIGRACRYAPRTPDGVYDGVIRSANDTATMGSCRLLNEVEPFRPVGFGPGMK